MSGINLTLFRGIKTRIKMLPRSDALPRMTLWLALLAFVVTIVSMAAAAGNGARLAKYYETLLFANIAIALGLSGLVILLILRLLWRLRLKQFGAKLTLKFTAAFVAMGLVPGIIVYLVSAVFLHQSIESWFSTRVDQGLAAGIALSRTALEQDLNALLLRNRQAAVGLAALPVSERNTAVGSLRKTWTSETGLSTEMTLFMLAQNSKTDALTEVRKEATKEVTKDSAKDVPKDIITADNLPSATHLDVLRRTGQVALIDATPLDDVQGDRLSFRVVSQIAAEQYLQTLQAVSPALAQQTQALQAGFKDYETISLGRKGLRKIYGTTLTLTMLVAVLAAVASGFLLADTLSRPLLNLASGIDQVAQGNFAQLPAPNVQSKDDLAVLTRSFNSMSTELFAAKSNSESAQNALESSNLFLQKVLGNMNAGVMVLLRQQSGFSLFSNNASAGTILGIKKLEEADFSMLPQGLQAELLKHSHSTKTWQSQVELDAERTLLLKGSPLTLPEGEGILLVFDDISDLLDAQRAFAWGEVARRLAHEIKNPLTPIQLSAERMTMKLAPKLQGADQELLHKSANTIITQVAALKRMVDEFKNFSRLPEAQLERLDLNLLVTDAAALYTTSNDAQRTVSVSLATEPAWVLADASQLRQIIHNLVTNGIDSALELHPSGGAEVAIQIETLNTTGVSAAAGQIALRVLDNGAGFAQKALAKVFEPYNTTKARGTGLGLAIVKRIVQEHSAQISAKNRVHNDVIVGASMEIIFQAYST